MYQICVFICLLSMSLVVWTRIARKCPPTQQSSWSLPLVELQHLWLHAPLSRGHRSTWYTWCSISRHLGMCTYWSIMQQNEYYIEIRLTQSFGSQKQTWANFPFFHVKGCNQRVAKMRTRLIDASQTASHQLLEFRSRRNNTKNPWRFFHLGAMAHQEIHAGLNERFAISTSSFNCLCTCLHLRNFSKALKDVERC